MSSFSKQYQYYFNQIANRHNVQKESLSSHKYESRIIWGQPTQVSRQKVSKYSNRVPFQTIIRSKTFDKYTNSS